MKANDKLAEEALRGKALVTHKDEVFKTAADPMVGNAKGDVTVVEFMDYNCGWCKNPWLRSMPWSQPTRTCV